MPKSCLCVFFGSFLMGEKKHINKIPPKIPGQSRENFVYVFFLYVFSLPKIIQLKSSRERERPSGSIQLKSGQDPLRACVFSDATRALTGLERQTFDLKKGGEMRQPPVESRPTCPAPMTAFQGTLKGTNMHACVTKVP